MGEFYAMWIIFEKVVKKKKERRDCSKPCFCLTAQPRPHCKPPDSTRLHQTQVPQVTTSSAPPSMSAGEAPRILSSFHCGVKVSDESPTLLPQAMASLKRTLVCWVFIIFQCFGWIYRNIFKELSQKGEFIYDFKIMLNLFSVPWKLARKEVWSIKGSDACFSIEVKPLPLDSTDMRFLIIQPGQGSRYKCKNTISNKWFAKQTDIMNTFSRTHKPT